MSGLLVLFSGSNLVGLPGLWVTDGTTLGTQQLAVTGASVLGFDPQFMFALGGQVLFGALDDRGLSNLWTSDGTGAGTSIVAVPAASTDSGLNPRNIILVGDKLVFSGEDAVNSVGLWESDGTTTGTTEMQITGASLAGCEPSDIAGFGNQVLFNGRDTQNHHALGVADLASGQGRILTIANASAAGLNPTAITQLGTIALFAGTDSQGLTGLWVTDGTATGTSELAVSGAAANGLSPAFMIAYNGMMLISGVNSVNSQTFWVSDGTAAGTKELDIAGVGPTGLAPGPFVAFNGKIYFSGLDANSDRGLWVTDGTAAGTSEIPISGTYGGAPGLAGGVNPSDFAVAGSLLLFRGIDAVGLTGLWETDGTSGGTREIAVDGADVSGVIPSSIAVLSGTPSAACFCSGTRLLTPHGERCVEHLAVGDDVITPQGNRSIIWIGHRKVNCRAHPRPWDVWPVRVAAGAFGPGQPSRDLWLSPDHAVFTGGGASGAPGVLIPVRYLVNGASIVQVPSDLVAYWHVELARHAILLAEGLSVESYLDTGNRSAFANAGATALHPDFTMRVWSRDACAKLVLDGAELHTVRRRLLERARALGHATTEEPALYLTAGDRIIRPERAGGLHCFRLPAAPGGVRLVSRSTVPAEIHPDAADHRRLGVAVCRVMCDGHPVALDDPRLSSGWHAPERDGAGRCWRWTDGDAGLALAGVRMLAVELAMTGRYWTARDDEPDPTLRLIA